MAQETDNEGAVQHLKNGMERMEMPRPKPFELGPSSTLASEYRGVQDLVDELESDTDLGLTHATATVPRVATLEDLVDDLNRSIRKLNHVSDTLSEARFKVGIAMLSAKKGRAAGTMTKRNAVNHNDPQEYTASETTTTTTTWDPDESMTADDVHVRMTLPWPVYVRFYKTGRVPVEYIPERANTL